MPIFSSSPHSPRRNAIRCLTTSLAIATCSLAACSGSPDIDDDGLPSAASLDGQHPAESDAARLRTVTAAVAELRQKAPDIVASWSPTRPTIEYLSGNLHGADARAAPDIARDVLLEYGAVFSIDAPEQLRPRQPEVSPRTGHAHIHFDQLLGGHPVLRQRVSVHVAPDGSVTAMNGQVEPGLRPEMLEPVETTVDDVEAEVRAAYDVRGDFVVYTDPRLVVSLHDGAPVLVWQLSVLADGMAGTVDLEVDANTGRIHHHSATGHGIQAIGCDTSGEQVDINTTHPAFKPFQLHDKTRPGKIRGYDQDGSVTWTSDDPITDADNQWCESDHEGPVTGHFNMARTLDYFDFQYGRNSYDDSGGNIKMGFDALIPLASGTTSFSAMSWSGGVFTFGHPSFTGLDTVAHEFTHSIIRSEDVTYLFPQGQAVHEHLADVFSGLVVQHFDGGPEANVLTAGVRDLGNPSVNDDHFSGFDASGSQYLNSRILSFAFALLVEGGLHPESNVQVPQVSLLALRVIYYEAINQFLSPGDVSFRELRSALLAAAGTYFGVGSTQHDAIDTAMLAVGIMPSTYSLIPMSPDFHTWSSGNSAVAFGAPQSSPGVGFTSAKMENGKLYDGEMMGLKPADGLFGHVAGEYTITLPAIVEALPGGGGDVLAPRLRAEIGFPLIAVPDDEALVLVQLRDADGDVLMQTYITARRSDGLVETIDWDLEAFADTSVTLRVVVLNTGVVPTRPVMFDSLRIDQVWQ